MARSQVAVRALLAASSLGLLLLTVLRSGHPVVVAVVVVVGLTAYACAVPDSPVVGVLVGGHVLHWLVAVPLPTVTTFTVSGWGWVLVAAWLVLAVHLSASLAASLPPGAALAAGTVRRWLRRASLAALFVVPVWAVTAVTAQQGVAGRVSFTYAAIAGTAILTAAVWLLSREPRS
ncbi:hypothetical protein [Pedococcus sp. 5OH_020]|uniref:hypothetical protein n=1 Tax=Pedococcus sp. 5OH_020 TaxID=2989814 RepID=UPI0022E9E930|nr:hypothetical protein [Pedococcus sp. 5OH_020]